MMKILIEKIKAIYHIFKDKEYAIYTVTVREKNGKVKRTSSCCFLSQKISHVFLDTIIDYSGKVKSETKTGYIDNLINYDTDK